MINKRTKFLVGLFVTSGVVIMVATVIWLGMTNFFQQGKNFAVYFDESVQGLDVEAPVKYRGVSIGRVGRINVAADSRLIEVILAMDPGISLQGKVFAQLKIVGITGNMFIELDQVKEGIEATSLELKFPTEYPVIPTRPSDIQQLFNKIDTAVDKLAAIDLAEIITQFQKTLEHLDQAIVGADVAALSAHIKSTLDLVDQVADSPEFPAILNRFNSLLVKLEKSVDDMDIRSLSEEAREALSSLRQESEKLLRTTQPLIKTTSETVYAASGSINNLNRQTIIVSQELAKAVSKLNNLLDQVNDNPSQLIFGEAPPRRLDEGNK
jgi:phospholipid/cholesterol/gamma-HCH transport system substrate-binding protein